MRLHGSLLAELALNKLSGPTAYHVLKKKLSDECTSKHQSCSSCVNSFVKCLKYVHKKCSFTQHCDSLNFLERYLSGSAAAVCAGHFSVWPSSSRTPYPPPPRNRIFWSHSAEGRKLQQVHSGCRGHTGPNRIHHCYCESKGRYPPWDHLLKNTKFQIKHHINIAWQHDLIFVVFYIIQK